VGGLGALGRRLRPQTGEQRVQFSLHQRPFSGRGVSGSLGAIFVRLGAFDKEELLEKQGEESFALSILDSDRSPLRMRSPRLPAGGMWISYALRSCTNLRRATAVSQGAAHGQDTHAVWRSKPSFYAVSTEDRTIDPDLERFMAKRMGATTIEVRARATSRLYPIRRRSPSLS
jgi:hypothetical protein